MAGSLRVADSTLRWGAGPVGGMAPRRWRRSAQEAPGLAPTDGAATGEADGATDPLGLTEPLGLTDPDGATLAGAAVGIGVGVASGVRAPPWPSSIACARIRTNTATVRITKIADA